jgi:DNA-binding response OmpR family regulator
LLVDPDREYRMTLRAAMVDAGMTSWGRRGMGSRPRSLSRARPDIVVIEVVLDDRDGLDVARLIRARDPDIQLILLGSESSATPLNERARRLYAAAFPLKSDGANWVVEAIGRASLRRKRDLSGE